MKAIRITFVFILLVLAGCKKDGGDFISKSRTVLVYLAGDNDLYQEVEEKIEALRAAYKPGMGRLVIYCDAAGKTPQLLEVAISQGSATAALRVLKNYEKENSASGEVVKRVLTDLKQEAPASSYGMILFSHASGWLPNGLLTKPASIAQDRSDALELADFASAIPDGFFDFMIFESCFMSGVEVAYELKDKTDYILGSSAEILSPGFTPIYSKLLPFLYKPEADLKGFAGAYYDHYNALQGIYRSATVSLINTSELSQLADWTKKNATISPLKKEVIAGLQHYDRYIDYSLFFDFTDYITQLIPGNKQIELKEVLGKIIVYKAATPQFMIPYAGFEIKSFSGMTTYVPQADFNFLNTEYKKLKWARDTGL